MNINILMRDWFNDLKKIERIQKLRETFMNATTADEALAIWNKNLQFMIQNPETWNMFNYALKRIKTVRGEKSKSWKLQDKN